MITPDPKKPKGRKPTHEPQPGSLRWRGTIVALVGSLVASLVCLGLLGTVVTQVKLIIPHGGSAEEREAITAAHGAWRSDWRINNAVAQLYVLANRDPNEKELAQWAGGGDNSLGIWADLLVRLRRAGIGPADPNTTQPARGSLVMQASSLPAAATRPAPDESILSVIQSLQYAPLLRIGIGPLHDTFIAAAVDHGLSARRAEAVFWPERYGNALAAYRPVLRELSTRLLALGRQYQQAGRPADAVRVYQAAIRGLTDAVHDSPLPEVALLAAGQAEPIARELARLQGKSAAPAADALAAFPRAWVEVPDRDLAIIPATFDGAPSPDLHRSVLASLTAGAGFLACGWMLAVLCLVLLIVIGVTRPFGQVPLAWRWGGWGAVIAPAVVILPMTLLVLFLASDAVPFIWLSSARSLGAIGVSPAILVLLWMMATRLCLRSTTPLGGVHLARRASLGGVHLARLLLRDPTHEGEAGKMPAPQEAMVPWPVVWAGVGLVLVAVLIALIYPLHGEPWRPSPGVQLFRRTVGGAGLVSIVVTLVWLVWGWRRRRKAKLPAGVWARGGLAVASTAMLVMLAFAAIGLAVNQQRDSRYEAAFARDIKDPISARLGPDWWQTCFAPARSLAE